MAIGMTFQPAWRRNLWALLAAWCAIVECGCASWSGPRIDPTGERFFIWSDPAPASIGYPSAVGVPAGQALAAPAVIAVPPLGNVHAPPVYSDAGPVAMVPAAPLPAIATGPGQPAVVAPASATLVVGRDHVRISPDRLMAPVGTEVVLRAGVCTAGNHLLADQRVEWLLARDGVGHFVDLNSRGEIDLLSWPPWFVPRKVDNWYAIGATSNFPVCLRRGTADPSDDVQIQRGEAWVSLTSPTEGTSVVTAFSPVVDDWQFRRATAMIYWIDAQWVFPPSAIVESGRPHVLTTVVSRRSDGAPVAGWTVRYEAAGAGASLGYAGGNVVDVPTDAAGRASVEVSPTDVGGGTTSITMSLIRQPQTLPTASPQLEVGRGTATITWAGGGVGAVPTPGVAAPSAPPPAPFEPAPSLPSTAEPGRGPGVAPPPAAAPELSLTLRRTSAERVTVGDFARFEVVVTNRGDGTARGIKLLDRFDRGLSHPQALPNEWAVKYEQMRDLAPGESATVPLTFLVVAAGEQCHEVTVTAEGSAPAVERGCIMAVEARPPAPPSLDVTKHGPTRHYVGELAGFRVVIRNTGDVPATNLEVIDSYDAALDPRFTDPGREVLDDGRFRWRIERLDPGERREINVQCACVTPTPSACSRVTVTGDGGINHAAEACVEIQPLVQPPGAARDGVSPPPAAAASDLRLAIVESPNPTRVGTALTIFVRVENNGRQNERDVAIRVLVPQEVTLNQTQIQPAGAFEIVGQREIRFTPIAELPPGDRREFVIPVNADRTGTITVHAQITAAGLAQPISGTSKPIEILPASQ